MAYSARIDLTEPVWQPGYYCFNIHSEAMLKEKLEYMHDNPVRAGLVTSRHHWKYGSARHYLTGQSVGIRLEIPGRGS